MKNYLKSLVIFYLMIGLLISAKTFAQDANEYYNRGIAFYGQKQYDLAIDNFTKTLNLSPNFANGFVYRGLSYYNKKEYASAMQDYNKAIILDPVNKIAFFNRGLVYYARTEYDAAIKDFITILNLDPTYINAYQYRGLSYYAKAQYDLAIQDYTRFLNQNPNDTYTYTSRGNAYYAKMQYDLAIQDYSKAITLNPGDYYTYSMRGLSYTSKNEQDNALKDYDKALSLNPAFAEVYYYKGYSLFIKKEYDLAIAEFNKVINLKPVYTDAYSMRGLSFKAKGDYTSSISDFEKTILIDPNYSKSYINIIEPLARQYRFSEAAKYYTTFRAKNSKEYIDDESYLFYKKYIESISQNLTNNNYQGALISLNEAEKLYKNRGQKIDDYQKNSYTAILALKGYVLEQLNKTEEAKQAYEQALIINTVQPDITAGIQRLTKKQEILVKADDTPPVITILEPATNRSFTIEDDKPSATQRIRGKAVDAGGIKKITINNNPLKMEEGGYFETTVNVKEGTNVFTVIAVDNNANSSSANVVIEGGKANNKPQPAEPAKAIEIPALQNASAYHAVLIAETDYNDNGIKNLPGTRSDMRKMYNLLVNNYNFSAANTDTLVNASKVSILESLIQKANAMKENDNLFIFYAGHGQMIKHEDNSEEGFLVPVDAGKNKTSSYISSDDLVRSIKYSKAKHILFVADACFAGGLFRDIASDAPEPVAEAYKDKSRKLLASGNRQAVPDQSEFIEYLRLALQENKQKYITAEQLIDSFKNQYKNTTHLQLQYYPIKNVDDLGGQFVFIRK